ncbi:unnamed protein product [Caenorhabditis auriculariae]|uniref:Uncharacterized protein n=1 Tax=Caenorhabditis auriculariae TaxID=2777116 RepID=A0A8S1HUU4_9PELO|nr:unnamed protein product [Caenorhabditis auriculariae]
MDYHNSDGCSVYATGESRTEVIGRCRACRTCVRQHGNSYLDQRHCRYCSEILFHLKELENERELFRHITIWDIGKFPRTCRRVTCFFCFLMDYHNSDGCSESATGKSRKQSSLDRHHYRYCFGRFGRYQRLPNSNACLCLIPDDMKNLDRDIDCIRRQLQERRLSEPVRIHLTPTFQPTHSLH